MSDTRKISSYYFTVEIDGIETARFQKCEGLEVETYVYEVEEGGNPVTHKFQGRTRYPNLILEKGISCNNELFNWYKKLMQDEKIERKNGSVVLRDLKDNEVKRWNFYRALPCRWIGPTLEASRSAEYAVEKIEITHEGLEVDSEPEVNEYNYLPHIGQDASGKVKITVTKYKFIHRNFTQYVYMPTGIELKRERERIVSQSELFDSEQEALNAAVRASAPFDKGQNIKHEARYIETRDMLVYNQYDREKNIYFNIINVNRWDMEEVQVTQE